jgi:hypothetical protein
VLLAKGADVEAKDNVSMAQRRRRKLKLLSVIMRHIQHFEVMQGGTRPPSSLYRKRAVALVVWADCLVTFLSTVCTHGIYGGLCRERLCRACNQRHSD